MLKQYIDKSIRRLSSLSPQAAIAGVLIIVVVVAGVALVLTRGGSEASANPALQPYAARLDRVDGSVGIARVVDGEQEPDWTEAAVNTPVTVGDRIYAREYAHASIALSGQNYVRLNPATSLDVLALEERRTQFALRSGSALFDVGALPAGEFYEVATPCGAVDFKEPGLYQIGMDGDNAVISVLNGLAQVVGQGGSGYLSKGQVFTLTGATATEALASSLAYDTAGEIVDDYYRYRYPKVYDGRYRSYDDYLDNPSYYDPYHRSVSYQYLPADIPGLYDLDYYGDWVDVNDYGYCWAPHTSAGWAPYRSGYWDLDGLWGPSWVSYEPWGWAPYHYGRWAFVNQRWFWVPVEVRTRPVYCPAPVAFIPFADQIAWVPLAPGEVYVARYYDDFRPTYLASPDVVRVVTVQNTFANYRVPNAVTVVPVRAFTQAIDPQVIAPVDVAVVQNSRAVIDPFSVAEVRELATRGESGRRRIKFERSEEDALNTSVVTSTTPGALPARGDLARKFRAEAVPGRKREAKLNIKETAQVTSSRRADGLPQPLSQSKRMNELASRAEKGDKSARREMRQLMREQRGGAKPEASQQPATQEQAQQQQLRQQLKQQRRAARQQQAQQAARQAPQQAPQQSQTKQQRRLERQQQQQQPPKQQRQQRKAQPQRPKRKPPEVSLQQQRIQRVQPVRVSRQQPRSIAQVRAARQNPMMQQQQPAARTHAAQRQAAIQQQAVRAQASQRRAASASPQRAPALIGPPARQDAPRKAPKSQRKPH